MKLTPQALYARLTEPDFDDVVDEVLAMTPEQVRAELRDLGYHLPTTRANIRRLAHFPSHPSTKGFIRAGLGALGASGIGVAIWSALTTAAPVVAPLVTASPPPSQTTTVTAATGAPAPELPDGGDDQ